ncbi:MAG: choice-of-anchor B family protein [Gemmatimonadetes bacterium]|nr:choice-of-anchor B family protein [Gemmatimonadota bacterium]
MKRVCSAVLLLLPLALSTASASGVRDERGPSFPQFGATVAIVGDQAFVGEPRGPKSGTVHLYRRGPTGWKETGTLLPPAGSPNDGFGTVLVANATTLLVSRIDGPSAPDSAKGEVHVFRRGANGAWTAAGVLQASSRVGRAEFGRSLALSGDLLMVGAPRDGNGVVYLYRRGADGSYAPAGTLPVQNSEPGDQFGAAIAVDGARLVVGAPGRSMRKGAVFAYGRQADGAWQAEGMLMAQRGTDNAQLGSALLLQGSRVIAGAPGALVLAGPGGGSAGAAVVFERSASTGAWRERQTLAPFQLIAGRFGATLAAAGDEIWIGAPATERNTGRVYRLALAKDGSLASMSALAVGDLEPGAGLSGSIATSGDAAVVGMPSDGGGGGTVLFLGRSPTGAWTVRNSLYPASTAPTYAAVKGKEVACGESGKAGEFECGNASLQSFLPISAIGGKRGTNMNDNWGWTDPVTKHEIAILGRTDGTSFVDVTDPSNPRYLGDLPKTKGSPSSAWRDMKTYKDHVFIVSDNAGEHGMQVFDLTRLRKVTTPQTFTPDVTYDRINSAHNIVSNEETGFMYTVGNSGGGETCGGGYHMIDVRDPKHPQFAGCFGDPKTGRAGTGYSHDAQCVVYRGPDEKYRGREICIGSNETAISIADLTDKKNPVAISRASYPNVAYAHQGWLTEDQKYFYLDDEGDESSGQGEAAKGTRTLVWDVSDLDDPVLVTEHVGVAKAIDHNLYVKGNRMYQANYTSGLRILDVTNPRDPREVGFFDTHPGDDGKPSFAGAWSVYPYFKSGTIVVTSIGEGVFFVRDRTSTVP